MYLLDLIQTAVLTIMKQFTCENLTADKYTLLTPNFVP